MPSTAFIPLDGGKDVEAGMEGEPTILRVLVVWILRKGHPVFAALLVKEVPASAGPLPTATGEDKEFVGAVAIDASGPERALP